MHFLSHVQNNVQFFGSFKTSSGLLVAFENSGKGYYMPAFGYFFRRKLNRELKNYEGFRIVECLGLCKSFLDAWSEFEIALESVP